MTYDDDEGLLDAPVYDGYDIVESASAVASPEIELPPGISLEWFPKQEAWWAALSSGEYNYMAYGGAIRGGKTFTVLMTVVTLMRMFPRSRHIVTRKTLPLIRKHVIPTVDKIRRYSGNFLGPLNKTDWTVTASNGSQMLFVAESLKDDPELEEWRGAEANTITLEESNELSKKMKVKAIERIGTYVIPPDREQLIAISRAREMGMSSAEAHRKYGPRQCPPFLFLTFNPADNWVRDDIYDPFERGELKAPWFFMPATIHDNPYNPPAFIKSVEQLRYEDYDAYERFVVGKWGNIRVENQLIDPFWLRDAREVDPEPGVRRLGVDVARYGKDSTILVEVDGNVVSKLTEERLKDTAFTATVVTRRHRDRGIHAHNITIDTNGLGAGVADMCRTNGIYVNEFVTGAKAVRRHVGVRTGGQYPSKLRSFYKFKNLWSQAAWEAREKFRRGQLRIAVTHPSLVRHLTSFRYEVTNREVNVWTSADVREELGFSPDIGVAVILALFEFPERARRRGIPSTVIGRPRRSANRAYQRYA